MEIELNDDLKYLILKSLDDSDEEIVNSAVKLLDEYDDEKIIQGFVEIYGQSDFLDEMFREKIFSFS